MVAQSQKKTSSSSARAWLSPVTSCERLLRDTLLFDEQVNQGLHRLHLLVGNELVVFGDGDEMDEAHVQNVMLVDVPKWIQPMCVVQMGIATEHLFHDALAVLVESLRKAAGLANPLLAGRICVGVTGIRTCSFMQCKGLWGAGDLLGGEHDRIMDLADNPLFNAIDELGSGYLGGTSVYKPSVGQTMGNPVRGGMKFGRARRILIALTDPQT
jgi:hypothetical protein